MFYLGGRGPRLNRYVGLSLVLHTALVLVFWSVAKTHLRAVRPAAIDVHIRTVPAFPSRPAMPPKPRPGLAQATAPTLPAAAPRRKIGRIIEKKFKLDMPEIQPQTALRRSGRDDEVRLRDKNVAKFVRSEQVELIDIERKQAYEPPAPAQTTAVQTPPGEYVPAAALAKVEVNIDYVEIPFDAPDKIDLDQVQWTPAVAARPTVAPPAGLPFWRRFRRCTGGWRRGRGCRVRGIQRSGRFRPGR